MKNPPRFRFFVDAFAVHWHVALWCVLFGDYEVIVFVRPFIKRRRARKE